MIETFPDPESLAEAATDAVVRALDAGLRNAGSASLAATGGRSPGLVYDALSLAPLDWARIRVTLTDERWADVDSLDSNEGLVRKRLLQNRAADAHFLGLRGHAATPHAAAELASHAFAGWPALDAALMGMGEDGHVASLFPGSPALATGLDRGAPACIDVPAGDGGPPSQPRLTLTLRPLTTARVTLILISGTEKRRVIEAAMAQGDPFVHPVAAVLKSAPALRILWTS